MAITLTLMKLKEAWHFHVSITLIHHLITILHPACPVLFGFKFTKHLPLFSHPWDEDHQWKYWWLFSVCAHQLLGLPSWGLQVLPDTSYPHEPHLLPESQSALPWRSPLLRRNVKVHSCLKGKVIRSKISWATTVVESVLH